MPSILRIVSNNAAPRATIIASSTAGSLTADRLKVPVKSRVWRSASTTATLTVTLATAEAVDCVALPFTNLTSSATMRVQGYALSGDSTPLYDTGDKLLTPTVSFDQFDWGVSPLGVNSFAYGGAAQAVSWVPVNQVQKIVITLTDTTNTAGYIEAACLVMGLSWSPKYNPSYGAGVMIKETTKNERTESGNLRSDRGVTARSLSFETKNLTTADRNKVWNLMQSNGMSNPAFFSLYPVSDDTMQEQIHQMFAKLTQQSKLSVQTFGVSQASFEVEEI